MNDSQDFDGLIRRLADIEEAVPNPLRKASARRRYLEQAGQLKQNRSSGRKMPAFLSSLRLALTVVLVALVLFSGALVGTAYAADVAIPGDALYPVDLQVEQVSLNLARGPEQAVDLSLSFAGERLQEIGKLISVNRQESVPVALGLYENIISGPVLARAKSDASLGLARARISAALVAHEGELQSLRDRALPEQRGVFDDALVAVEAEMRSFSGLDEGMPFAPTAAPRNEQTAPVFGEGPAAGDAALSVDDASGNGEAGWGEGASALSGEQEAGVVELPNGGEPSRPVISNPGQDGSLPPGLANPENPGVGNPGAEPEPPGRDKDKDKGKGN